MPDMNPIPKIIQDFCSSEGWTDPFQVDGDGAWYAFPPNAVQPVRLEFLEPEDQPECQLVSEEFLALLRVQAESQAAEYLKRAFGEGVKIKDDDDLTRKVSEIVTECFFNTHRALLNVSEIDENGVLRVVCPPSISEPRLHSSYYHQLTDSKGRFGDRIALTIAESPLDEMPNHQIDLEIF